jgi:hypothetical protein
LQRPRRQPGNRNGLLNFVGRMEESQWVLQLKGCGCGEQVKSGCAEALAR